MLIGVEITFGKLLFSSIEGFFYTYPLILFLDTNMDQDFLIHHELSQVLIHLI
jgi:hypothetical protein